MEGFEPLDRASAMPLYAQLADTIAKLIASGRFAMGDLIPSETQLSAMFAVSRLTVRQAMAKLVNDGLVHRERGRGTYVRSLPVLHHFAHSFEEELAADHIDIAIQLRGWQLVEPTSAVRQALQLQAGEQVFELDRIKSVGDQPIGCERRYLPHRIGSRISRRDAERRPVYRLIKNAIGVEVDRIVSTVSSIGASASIARLLQVPKREPLLLREQTYFARDNTPLMQGTVIFIGSRYRFVFECGAAQLKMDAFVNAVPDNGVPFAARNHTTGKSNRRKRES